MLPPDGIIAPGIAPPLVIAHGAGNASAATAAALDAGADYIEVDLWVHRNGFEARHERRLPFGLPALYEKWYISRPRQRGEPLQPLLEACRGRAGLFLDLKNGGERPSRLVASALARLDRAVPVLASSQFWPILRAVARTVPQVPVYYSVDVVAKLDLLLSIAAHDPLPAGTSCRHELLTAGIVERLHAEGLAVVAWTVDEEHRARELAAMGVDAITTHHPAEIRRALGHRP
jgi:glycerophosphoryl diester phosphodiesterase